MRRRHRRVLFNAFAFSLLGIALYLNLFHIYDNNIPASTTAKIKILQPERKTGSVLKMSDADYIKN